MKKTLPIILLLAMLMALPLFAQDTARKAAPDLSGQWRLNPGLSDDMGAIMRRATSGSRMQGSRGGRGGGRGGMRGGGMGGEVGGGLPGNMDDKGGPSDRLRKGAEEMRKRQAILDIFHEGNELNITDGLDITRLLHTDGLAHPVWTEMGQATAVATWKGDILEVTWQNERQPEPRIRRYQIIDDGARLQITEKLRLPDQRKPATIKLVYDRQAPPKAE